MSSDTEDWIVEEDEELKKFTENWKKMSCSMLELDPVVEEKKPKARKIQPKSKNFDIDAAARKFQETSQYALKKKKLSSLEQKTKISDSLQKLADMPQMTMYRGSDGVFSLANAAKFGGAIDKANTPCVHFVAGCCTRAQRCPFRHSVADGILEPGLCDEEPQWNPMPEPVPEPMPFREPQRAPQKQINRLMDNISKKPKPLMEGIFHPQEQWMGNDYQPSENWRGNDASHLENWNNQQECEMGSNFQPQNHLRNKRYGEMNEFEMGNNFQPQNQWRNDDYGEINEFETGNYFQPQNQRRNDNYGETNEFQMGNYFQPQNQRRNDGYGEMNEFEMGSNVQPQNQRRNDGYGETNEFEMGSNVQPQNQWENDGYGEINEFEMGNNFQQQNQWRNDGYGETNQMGNNWNGSRFHEGFNPNEGQQNRFSDGSFQQNFGIVQPQWNTQENENKIQKNKPKKKKQDFDLSELYCEICEKQCTDSRMYWTHIASQEHSLKIAQQQTV